MKMHGLGNDFVVVDARAHSAAITPALAQAIGHRRLGVGFDQLAVIEPARAPGTVAHLVFFNADGSLSAACGNATRCIGRFLIEEAGAEALTVSTERGLLAIRDAGQGLTSVNMGAPQLDWAEIPLAEPVETLSLPIDGAPVATGMGNPHCTFFVEDAEAVPLDTFGPRMEHHPLFPHRTNVQIAQITGPDRIRMRVWERGAGITMASGSSSCAVAVAAARRGLTGRAVSLDLDGGTLAVEWRDDGVWMTGPTAHVFSGALAPEWLEQQ